MKREHLYEPFSISFETLDEYPKRKHQYSFFELVYIIDGTGTQWINQHTFHYKPGHMFLLTPQDEHAFDIKTPTQFFFLRFNSIYIQSKSLQADSVQRLEFILQNASHQPGCILKNQTDKCLVRPMIEAMIREYVNRDLYNKELVQQLVNTLIIVVARNIAKYLPQAVNERSDERIWEILNYIQAHIHEPEKLRTEAISKQFGIAENYLGRYFKKHCAETMQSYIADHKTTLIEHRLKHSDKRINEIAAELGFTDVSHLNKFFKQQRGMSLRVFRDEHA